MIDPIQLQLDVQQWNTATRRIEQSYAELTPTGQVVFDTLKNHWENTFDKDKCEGLIATLKSDADRLSCSMEIKAFLSLCVTYYAGSKAHFEAFRNELCAGYSSTDESHLSGETCPAVTDNPLAGLLKTLKEKFMGFPEWAKIVAIVAPVMGCIVVGAIIHIAGTPKKEEPREIRQSLIAYKNGVQSLKGKDYTNAIREFRHVSAHDKRNYNNAQKQLGIATKAYKKELFASFSKMEKCEEYTEIIGKIETATILLPTDTELPKKQTMYENRWSEKDRKFVLGRIKEIEKEASKTKDFSKGFADLKSLSEPDRHRAFDTEINVALTSLTALLAKQQEKTVLDSISEIKSRISASKDYDSGRTEFKKLLNEYPAFETEINKEISKLIHELVTIRIKEINESIETSQDYDGGITALKELSEEYNILDEDISKAIAMFTANLLKTAQINLDQPSIPLNKGTSKTLSVVTVPANIQNLEYTWKSSVPAVAVVDNNGKVTATGFGKANIELLTSDGAVRATCVISINAMLGRDVPAYQANGIKELNKDTPANMMGAEYDNGLVGSGTIHYNIGGKYAQISGIFGVPDSSFEGSTQIEILGDNKLLKTHDLKHDDDIQNFMQSVTGITQLSFKISSTVHGIFNIMLFTDDAITPRLNDPKRVDDDTALLGRDIKAYKVRYATEFIRTTAPIKMMGKEYEYGVVNDAAYKTGGYPATKVVTLSRAYYNLNGRYKSLSGVFGPLDGISPVAEGTIRILGDGKVFWGPMRVKCGDLVRPFSIDVTGMTKIVIEITSNNSSEYRKEVTARFGLTDMNLSQEAADDLPGCLSRQSGSSVPPPPVQQPPQPKPPQPAPQPPQPEPQPPPQPPENQICVACSGEKSSVCKQCKGAKTITQQPQRKQCVVCNGRGNIPNPIRNRWLPDRIACPTCLGNGLKETTPAPTRCPRCQGVGRQPCTTCNGTGTR